LTGEHLAFELLDIMISLALNHRNTSCDMGLPTNLMRAPCRLALTKSPAATDMSAEPEPTA
jgi:hypothetical protein